MYGASGVGKDLREAERIPRPREAPEAATDRAAMVAGTAAGARGVGPLDSAFAAYTSGRGSDGDDDRRDRRTPKDVSSCGRPRLVPAALRPVREARRRRSSPPSAPRASRDATGSARSRRRLWHGQSGGADQAPPLGSRRSRARPRSEGARQSAAEGGARRGLQPPRSRVLGRAAVSRGVLRSRLLVADVPSPPDGGEGGDAA